MFKCPHCHQKSITFFQKFGLVLNAKNRNHRCQKCSGFVTASFPLTMLMLPFVAIPLLILYTKFERLWQSDFIGATTFFFITISVLTFLVPLKKLTR